MSLTRIGSLIAALLLVSYVASAPAQAARIRGTNGSDHLVGTAQDDVIRALAGRDYVSGRGGHDELFGGAGADTVRGGDRGDGLQGLGGPDRLVGGARLDLLLGGVGNDLIIGGGGQDFVGWPASWSRANVGADTLRGGPGADELFGGRGADLLRGGGNASTTRKFLSREFLYPGSGEDKVFAGPHNDGVSTTTDGSPDVIDCGRGNDILFVDEQKDPLDVTKSCEKVRECCAPRRQFTDGATPSKHDHLTRLVQSGPRSR